MADGSQRGLPFPRPHASRLRQDVWDANLDAVDVVRVAA